MGRVRFGQAGYVGYSMSENAMTAYELGEKPRSKWTKKAMLEAIEETLYLNNISSEKIIIFSSMKKDELFNMCFTWTSWHHTGKYANETDFYGVDEIAIIEFANE